MLKGSGCAAFKGIAKTHAASQRFICNVAKPSRKPIVPAQLGGNLFGHQSSLPRLPVPCLEKDTVPALMRSLKAIAEADPKRFEKSDYDAACELLKRDFLAPSSIGRVIHERLLERASSKSISEGANSWLQEWWNAYAYFTFRDPVVFNVNYFFHFADPVPAVPNDSLYAQLHRAAQIARAGYDFAQAVASQTLKPERSRTGPLCSQQYHYMFSNCRIPAKGCDFTHFYDPTKHTHVAVARKGQFYIIPMHSGTTSSTASGGSLSGPPSSLKPLSVEELVKVLSVIVLDAEKNKAIEKPPIGVLTTNERDAWASDRARLLAADPKNAAALAKLESALFLLCLDDSNPKDLNECSRLFWHGDGRNRFFDKSLQFIVAANAKAGFNGEHSLMDATPTGRLCEHILEAISGHSLLKNSPKTTNNSASAQTAAQTKIGAQKNAHLGEESGTVKFERLDFIVNSEVADAVKKASSAFDALSASHEVDVLAYRRFGKEELKKLGISPDAFVQIGLQLAYARMHGGRIAAVYETAQTRGFLCGRTEAGRTVTVESIAFVRAIEKHTGRTKELGNARLAELGAMCHAAAKSHGDYMKKSAAGKGIDRHLLGMRMLVSDGEKAPEIYENELFKASKNWQMSTSQLSSEYFDGYGWGQVVPDGYGLPYMINGNGINVNIASLNLGSKKLNQHVQVAFDDIYEILQASKNSLQKSKM